MMDGILFVTAHLASLDSGPNTSPASKREQHFYPSSLTYILNSSIQSSWENVYTQIDRLKKSRK